MRSFFLDLHCQSLPVLDRRNCYSIIMNFCRNCPIGENYIITIYFREIKKIYIAISIANKRSYENFRDDILSNSDYNSSNNIEVLLLKLFFVTNQLIIIFENTSS